MKSRMLIPCLIPCAAMLLAGCSSGSDSASDPAGDSAAPSTSRATSSLVATSTTSAALPTSAAQEPTTSVEVPSAAMDSPTEAPTPAPVPANNTQYSATINNEPVMLANHTAACAVNEQGVHFNASNENDSNDWVLDVMLTPDNQVTSIGYANTTTVALMSEPGANYEVKVDGNHYAISGEGIGSDLVTKVPFNIEFTCS